jgi:hypothetical protein
LLKHLEERIFNVAIMIWFRISFIKIQKEVSIICSWSLKISRDRMLRRHVERSRSSQAGQTTVFRWVHFNIRFFPRLTLH